MDFLDDERMAFIPLFDVFSFLEELLDRFCQEFFLGYQPGDGFDDFRGGLLQLIKDGWEKIGCILASRQTFQQIVQGLKLC